VSLHGLVRLGSRLSISKVDVAEALAAAALAIGDDAGVGETLELLEGLVERIVINVPA
jgi:hypothetical protein